MNRINNFFFQLKKIIRRIFWRSMARQIEHNKQIFCDETNRSTAEHSQM
jgi:hypothetical protein